MRSAKGWGKTLWKRIEFTVKDIKPTKVAPFLNRITVNQNLNFSIIIGKTLPIIQIKQGIAQAIPISHIKAKIQPQRITPTNPLIQRQLPPQLNHSPEGLIQCRHHTNIVITQNSLDWTPHPATQDIRINQKAIVLAQLRQDNIAKSSRIGQHTEKLKH